MRPVEPQPARVVMIEDQISYAEAFGLALTMTPDFELVGRASDAKLGIEMCGAAKPDLVVCDYRLPDGDTGVAIAERLRAAGFTAPMVILTGFLAPQVVREAADVDNLSVMSKDTPILELVTELRNVLKGIDPRPVVAENPPRLSLGELEVLEMLNQGMSAGDIATELHLSLHTIRARIKSTLRKLKANSQLEALAVATRLGLLVPPS